MKYQLSLLLALTFLSCNPVKLAFKEKNINKTKEEFFRRKLCVVDSFIDTVTTTDTFTTIDTINEKTIIYDGLKGVYMDTTIGDIKLSIHNGAIKARYIKKTKNILKSNTITQQLRDKSYEYVLESDINFKDSILKEQEFIIKNKISDIKTLTIKFYGLLFITIFYVGFRIKRAFF